MALNCTFMHCYLTASEITIAEMVIKDLADATKTNGLSAEEVLNAFSHGAALAHQWRMGPLYGFPISLKDQCHVKGVETTMGYTGWIGTFQGKKDSPRYKNHKSVIITALRNSGAMLYVRTGVPHTVLP
ncbi:general amidase [Fusarium mexicanum]|uniref:General amidase n=1 Tax=Fusarium mexicanum TaxID=751941 RepID=A0A8H5JQM6_9HYPO|nr:general amidase [Fusarium mexicanum]